MNNQEKTLTAMESIDVIQKMINNTKSNFGKEDSFYYIFWGLLMLLASLFHFILLKARITELAFLAWPILSTLGIIVTILYAAKKRKTKKNETFLDHFMSIFYSTASLLFIFGVFFCVTHAVSPTSFVMLYSGVYGIVSGRILKFNPLTLGGVIFIGLSVVANYVALEIQLLLLSIGIIFCYITPGYLPKSKSIEDASTA